MDILKSVHSYLPVGFNILFCSKETLKFPVSNYDWKFISKRKPPSCLVDKFNQYIIYKEYMTQEPVDLTRNEDEIINTITTKLLSEAELECIPREYLDIILMFQNVSEQFIINHLPFEREEWDMLWTFQVLSEDFILKYKDFWNETMWKNQILSEDFITRNIDCIPSIELVLENQNVSEQFVINHIDKIQDLSLVYTRQELSDEFYLKYKWKPLVIHSKTSNELIMSNIDILDIYGFLVVKKHDEQLLRFVINNRSLSRNDWDVLWMFQRVSEQFILEHFDKIDNNHSLVIWSQEISLKFVKEHFFSQYI